MEIAAYYCRVSTGRQEKEATIKSQIAEVEEKIRQSGNILGEDLRFADEGWSGDLLARPALDAMRDAAVKKEFEVLYVWDRDRIARKYAYQELILEELEESGIEIVDLHSSEIKTPEDKILLGFKGLFAEYEKVKIAERMRRGKLFKARSGKPVHGPGGYGYTYIPKTKDKDGYFVINQEQINNVRRIFQLVVEEGLSIRKLIAKLYKLEIYPPKSKRRAWSNNTLCRLLRNEAYIGRGYYNKTTAIEPIKPLKNEKYKKIKKSSRKLRPRDEWIPIKYPKTINKDLFYKAQEQLKVNAKFSQRNKKHNYLLSGLMYCDCGERMGCEGGNNPNRYYRGEARLKHYPLETPCKAAGINTDRVDGVVWNKVISLLTSPELIQRQAERWLNGKEKRDDLQEDIDNIKVLLSQLDEEEKRQAKAYGQEIITFQSFKELMDDIKQRRQSLNKQLLELLAKQQHQQVIPVLSVDQVVQAVPAAIGKFEFEDKRKVLMSLIKEIIINQARTHVKIRGYIPLYLEKEVNQKYELRSISRYCRASQ